MNPYGQSAPVTNGNARTGPGCARHDPAKAGSRRDSADIAAQNQRVLYGGSVKPGNAAELFAQPDIDGGLDWWCGTGCGGFYRDL